MATTPTVYVICDKNCRFEGMTKEQIFTAIVQAVESGEIKDVDAGFITTIKTINGVPLKFFAGEQAVYDALPDEEKVNLFALITNDTTKAGILAAIEKLNTWKAEVMDGKTAVPIANKLNTNVITNCTEEGSITKAGIYLIKVKGFHASDILFVIDDLTKVQSRYVYQYSLSGSKEEIYINVTYNVGGYFSVTTWLINAESITSEILSCILLTEL